MSLQKQILDYLEGLDHCWPVKVISSNKRGCPDILCCYRGVFVAIEVKEGSGRQTRIQKVQRSLIRTKAQGYTALARNIETVQNIIKLIDLWRRTQRLL
jgi:Holliday junction resolvase